METGSVARNHLTATGILAATVWFAISTSAFCDGIKKIETTFSNGATLRFYGQINKGFLNFDDGEVSETYGLIDNNNSVSRVGLTYHRAFENWDYLATIEVKYAPFSTDDTSLLQPSPPSSAYDLSTADIRKIDNQFSSSSKGTFYFGQGSMASDETARVDLSGTNVIARSSVEDTAGGQLLRQSNGTLSSVSISDAFNDYDGLSRQVRVRYDTALVSGFGLRTSYGRNLLSDEPSVRDQNLFDVAATYAGTQGDFEVAAQAAYSWKGDDTTIASGSASILHRPTGLNFTMALGQQDSGSEVGSYGYLKLGQQLDLVEWGKTAFSIDGYWGNDIAAIGSQSTSAGLSVVQNITKWNTEVYASWRSYDYQEDTVSFDTASAFFLGARFKF